MTRGDFWVSPSSFAWAWTDCKRCWWLSMTARLKQPRSGMPPVVERVDRLTLDTMRGLHLGTVGVPGVVREVGKKVRAKTLELDGHLYTLGGALDLLVELDDGEGWGVFDVKMTMPKADTADKYRRQNAAYAYALTNPSTGQPVQVTRTGLLCVTPIRMTLPAVGIAVADQYTGEVLHRTYDEGALDPQEDPESALVFTWQLLPQATGAEQVQADVDQVRATMDEMAAIIATGKAPASAGGCYYCAYVRTINQTAAKLREQGLESLLENQQTGGTNHE